MPSLKSPLFLWSAGLILSLAILVRIPALFNDLWFDEIWSLSIALSAPSFWDVLTTMQHDNNHLLNTWILRLLGYQPNWMIYRLLPFFSGIGLVVMAGIIAKEHGRGVALISMALNALAFPLVIYSTEARGYAPAMLFALVSIHFMQKAFDRHRWWLPIAFGLSAMLGFLAHLSFVYVYLAILVWSIRKFWNPLPLFIYHTFPLMVIKLLYWIQIRPMVVGGGDQNQWLDVINTILNWTIGTPDTGVLSLGVGCLVLLAIGWQLLWWKRENKDLWILYSIAIFGAPLLIILITQYQYAQVRYFLMCLPLVLIVLAALLVRLWNIGSVAKFGIVGIALIFCLGNGWRLWEFYQNGRGQYQAVVKHMIHQTQGNRITLASDHSERNGMLLNYYLEFESFTKQFLYLPDNSWPVEGPQWYLMHNMDRAAEPDTQWISPSGQTYTLAFESRAPLAGVSGWHWFLYEKQAP